MKLNVSKLQVMNTPIFKSKYQGKNLLIFKNFNRLSQNQNILICACYLSGNQKLQDDFE